MKPIVVVGVLLFGLLLISTIGVSTAVATKPDWTVKSDAEVITPKPAGESGTTRAIVHVPIRAIERSPVLWEINGGGPGD